MVCVTNQSYLDWNKAERVIEKERGLVNVEILTKQMAKDIIWEIIYNAIGKRTRFYL